ncbi:MAG: ral secretion pathway protein [Verrucomicrobiota bacterium]|jgi:prepilin-type N-terminal cleavage/methylation domain-containing protein
MPVSRTDAEMEMNPSSRPRLAAFTLIELLVVIAIIAVLAAFLFPAFQGMTNRAKTTQAKSDLMQIVTAVNAYYTEYGKYPIPTTVTTDTALSRTDDLFYTLRAVNPGSGANSGDVANPRKIVFLSPADAKDTARPRSGIAAADVTVNGVTITKGEFIDPWGTPYKVAIDGDYDNQINPNPYGATGGAGSDPIRAGVIAWSLGKNGQLGGGSALNSAFDKEGGTANIYTGSGDVISWQ